MDSSGQAAVPPAQPSSPSRASSIGAALIAIATQLALLDAAFETFWFGSPLRWWIALPAVAFVAVSGWLWRPGGGNAKRWGWPGAASWSVSGPLLLLTVTAWLPDGQTNGVRMLRQPTTTLLTATTAAAVLLAAFALFRALAVIPARARMVSRIVLFSLAGYALLALCFAMYERAPYASLFQGGALWQRLPHWFQGTFIGALVLLPLGILGQAIRVTYHLRARQPVWVLLRQATALVMAFVMALSGYVFLPLRVQGSVATVGTTPGTTGGDSAGRQLPPPPPEQLDRLFAALRAAEKEIPRESFDPQAVVARVGNDPIRLFKWVRDNTHWVPYHGALRGPVGLLMDPAGNSLDRSLLLAELLQRAGYSVRLAHSRLPDAQARDLLGKVRQAPLAPQPASPSAEERNAAIVRTAKQHQLDESDVRQAVDANTSLADAILKGVNSRAQQQSEALMKALGEIPQVDDASAKAADAAALADHWWVQRQDQAAWVDLDPLLPGAEPGEVAIPAEDTFPIRVADGAVHLDARFYQEVEVRLIVERRQAGKLTEQVVLTHTLRPAELIGQRITLLHVPVQWPKGLNLMTEADPVSRLKAELLKLKEWRPVLVVGNKGFNARATTILTTGEVKAKRGPVGGISPFGGLGGGLAGDEGSSNADSEFTAEWVDYVIKVPGQPSRTIRREAFDLLGAVARASGQAATAKRFANGPEIPALYLLDRTDIILQAGRFSPEYLSQLTLGGMLRGEAEFRNLVANPEGKDKNRRLAQLLEQVLGLSPFVLTVAISRFASESAPAVYLATPNILCYRKGITFGPKGESVYEGVLDLAANEVTVLPRARAESFRIRLRQGVADTVAEGLPPFEVQPYGNASRMFDWAKGQGIDPVAIYRADDAMLKDPGLPAAAAVRMRDALARGYTLVAPRRAVGAPEYPRTCWWRVNPRTGETVGVMDTGYNAGQTTEMALTIQEVAIITEIDMAVAATVVVPAAGGVAAGQVLAAVLGCLTGLVVVAGVAWHMAATREGYKRAYDAGYNDARQRKPPRQAPQ